MLSNQVYDVAICKPFERYQQIFQILLFDIFNIFDSITWRWYKRYFILEVLQQKVASFWRLQIIYIDIKPLCLLMFTH